MKNIHVYIFPGKAGLWLSQSRFQKMFIPYALCTTVAFQLIIMKNQDDILVQ